MTRKAVIYVDRNKKDTPYPNLVLTLFTAVILYTLAHSPNANLYEISNIIDVLF